MHIKCSDCKGHKTVKGLGLIERKCPTCKGVGYVESDRSSSLDVMAHNAPRRGRPSKDKVL